LYKESVKSWSLKIHEASCLCGSDKDTEGARVVVIEPGNVETSNSGELVRESLASGTRSGGDDLLGTDSDRNGGDGLGGRNVVVRGGLGGRSAELRNSNGATRSESVVGGLEQALGRESENEVAGHAGVVGRYIEVKDGAGGAVDGSEVLSTVCLVRSGGVDGDNQVGDLVSSGEAVGADFASGGGRGRSRGRCLRDADDSSGGESGGEGAGRLNSAGRGGRNNDSGGAVSVDGL